MLIPEVKPGHAALIRPNEEDEDRQGFIAVKANCSLSSYLPPVYALMAADHEAEAVVVSTLHAVSGAGYPGVASIDMIDNVVPAMSCEEEKTEQEALRIPGTLQKRTIAYAKSPEISAHCNRVPVTDGHTACISLGFASVAPSPKEIRDIWAAFEGLPQKLDLPSAPRPPIVYREGPDRPKARRAGDTADRMAITVGRLRTCLVMDIRFVALAHNTIRGAVGGAILTAELLTAQGFLGD